MRGLILELVEGDTLADRLATGPLPIPEALRTARQIGEALDAAHLRALTGRRAFGGDTVSDTLVAILGRRLRHPALERPRLTASSSGA